MTNKELEMKLIRAIKLKEGNKNLTVNTLENAAFNNNLKSVGVLDLAKRWAGVDDYKTAVEKVIENTQLNFLVKDFVIVSYLAYNLKLMGRVRIYNGAKANEDPKVLFYTNMVYTTGYIVKKRYVYPLVVDGDSVTNKGQKSLRVKANPHYAFLKKLTYQYEIYL